MKRLPYLNTHLRGINRSMHSERKRFFRLYPVAVTVLALAFGYCWMAEKKARAEALKPCLPVGQSVYLLYRQTTDAGISISENERKLSFTF
jgi:hypothetical protein